MDGHICHSNQRKISNLLFQWSSLFIQWEVISITVVHPMQWKWSILFWGTWQRYKRKQKSKRAKKSLSGSNRIDFSLRKSTIWWTLSFLIQCFLVWIYSYYSEENAVSTGLLKFGIDCNCASCLQAKLKWKEELKRQKEHVISET